MPPPCARALVLAGALAPAAAAPGDVFTWDGECGDNWHDCCFIGKEFRNNWSVKGDAKRCPPLPGPEDDVVTNDMVFLTGDNVAVRSLAVSGTLVMNYDCGCGLDIVEGGWASVLGSLLEPAMIVFERRANLDLRTDATLDVASLGTIDIRTDSISAFIRSVGPGTHLSNRGTIRKSAGDGSFTIGVPLSNDGLVDAWRGTIFLTHGGGSSRGRFLAGGDAGIAFDGIGGKPHGMLPGSSMVGPGTITIHGNGRVIVEGDYDVAETVLAGAEPLGNLEMVADGRTRDLTLTFSGNSTLAGAGHLEVTGRLDCVNGAMIGTGRTIVSGEADIDQLHLKRMLDVEGSARIVHGAYVRFYDRGHVNNFGTLELAGDNLLSPFGDDLSVYSEALVTKTGGVTTMQVPFHNVGDGIVAVEGGILRLEGGGAGAARFDVRGGTTLAFGGPPYLLFPTATITGAGTVEFLPASAHEVPCVYDVGRTRIAGIADFLGDAFTDRLEFFFGGNTTLAGDGVFLVRDALHWSLGQMTGPGVTHVLGETTIDGTVWLDRRLDLAGPTIFAGGWLRIADRGALLNSGTFTVADDGAITSFGAGSRLDNFGTLVKTGGTGANGVSVPVTNAGMLVVESGSIQFSGGFTQVTGETRLAGGGLGATPLDPVLVFEDGRLAGAGRITGRGVEVGGSVHPGLSTGTLEIGGAYAQTGSGSLVIELAADDDFDRLLVGGPATLAGELVVATVEGYRPGPGTRFEIIAAGSVAGEFDRVRGCGFVVEYEADRVVLVAAKNPHPADINCDGFVDFDDLLAVLASWGPCDDCPADTNGDGVVDFDDLLAVLANWGPAG